MKKFLSGKWESLSEGGFDEINGWAMKVSSKKCMIEQVSMHLRNKSVTVSGQVRVCMGNEWVS